jgi:hypothetical protein
MKTPPNNVIPMNAPERLNSEQIIRLAQNSINRYQQLVDALPWWRPVRRYGLRQRIAALEVIQLMIAAGDDTIGS